MVAEENPIQAAGGELKGKRAARSQSPRADAS